MCPPKCEEITVVVRQVLIYIFLPKYLLSALAVKIVQPKFIASDKHLFHIGFVRGRAAELKCSLPYPTDQFVTTFNISDAFTVSTPVTA